MLSPTAQEAYIMAECDDDTSTAVYKVKILSRSGKFAKILFSNGKSEEALLTELLPIDPKSVSGSENLLDITFYTETNILVQLETRFLANSYLTHLHRLLIYLNPNKPNSMISESLKILNKSVGLFGKKPNKSNQCLIFNGERGSGKTFLARKIIKEIISNEEFYLKIKAANCVLQCFGNASGSLNKNASRFVNFIKLYFKDNSVCGVNYKLLNVDKFRVTTRCKSELNFHIFYLIRHFKSDEFIALLKISKKKFNYASEPFENGKKLLNRFESALSTLNLSEYTIPIFRIISGILCLGNISFIESNEQVYISDPSKYYLKFSSRLLDIPEDLLEFSLLSFNKHIGKTSIVCEYDKNDCEIQRDKLAQFLYQELRNWVTTKVNSSLGNMQSDRFIAIFEGLGTENLQENSLDQLLINYGSEKIHQLINDFFFVQPELDINFVDNKPIVELFEDKTNGIFKMINEFSSSGKRIKLTEELVRHHKFNDYFEASEKKMNEFIVHHNFDKVFYSADEFKSKNVDFISDDLVKCCQSSKSLVISEIFTESRMVGDEKLFITRWTNDLNAVLDEIHGLECMFIYCIRTNNDGSIQNFDQRLVLKQIQQFSLLDFIVLFKKHYKTTYSLKDFCSKYKTLFFNYDTLSSVLKNFIKSNDFNPSEIIINSTHVSIAGNIFEKFNKSYRKSTKLYKKSAVLLQRFWRNKSQHLKFKSFVRAVKSIQSIYRARDDYNRYNKIKSSTIKIQRWFRGFLDARLQNSKESGLKAFKFYLTLWLDAKLILSLKNPMLKDNKLWKALNYRLKKQSLASSQHSLKFIITKAWETIICNSATSIQKHIRGYLSRQTLPEQLKNTLTYNRTLRKIIKIQRFIKSHLIRKKFLVTKSAVITIQKFFRKRYSQYTESLKLSSIILIQRHTRNFLTKIRQIKLRLSDFLTQECELLSNLQSLEHSYLFSSSLPLSTSSALNLLSTLTKSSSLPKSQLSSTGSLALQTRIVNPFHIEKMYFFSRVLSQTLLVDTSLVYEHLWAEILENLSKKCIENEEQILDIKVGDCHSVAVSSRGKVFVWGWNDLNQGGRKGKAKRVKVEGRVQQVSCGADHTLMMTDQGEVHVFGDNSRGQLGQGHYSQDFGCFLIKLPPAAQVSAYGHRSLVLTAQGDVYIWPAFTPEGTERNIPTLLPMDIQIAEISTGFNFAAFLASSGLVFTFGSNYEGQLGLGDLISRDSPTLISILKKSGEKISMIRCGFTHMIAKSTLGKAFTWGSNTKGELGISENKIESLPKALVLKNAGKIVQVAAGFHVSLVMMENRKVLWAGCGNLGFEELKLEKVVPEFNGQKFEVVKVECLWSRTMAVVLGTFVDLRHVNGKMVRIKSGVNLIAAKWGKGIDPPIIETLTPFYNASAYRMSPLRKNE